MTAVLVWLLGHKRLAVELVAVAGLLSWGWYGHWQAGRLDNKLALAQAKLALADEHVARAEGEAGKAKTIILDLTASIEKLKAASDAAETRTRQANEEVERLRILQSHAAGDRAAEAAKATDAVNSLPPEQRCAAALSWLRDRYREEVLNVH